MRLSYLFVLLHDSLLDVDRLMYMESVVVVLKMSAYVNYLVSVEVERNCWLVVFEWKRLE